MSVICHKRASDALGGGCLHTPPGPCKNARAGNEAESTQWGCIEWKSLCAAKEAMNKRRGSLQNRRYLQIINLIRG